MCSLVCSLDVAGAGGLRAARAGVDAAIGATLAHAFIVVGRGRGPDSKVPTAFSIPMHEFQKEQMLHRRQVEAAIAGLDAADTDAAREVVQFAADVVAEHLMHDKFGCFEGGDRSVAFSVMGPPNAFLREELRAELARSGVRELGVAVAPEDERYVWAVLIDSPDGERWVELLRELWVRQPWDSPSGGEAS